MRITPWSPASAFAVDPQRDPQRRMWMSTVTGLSPPHCRQVCTFELGIEGCTGIADACFFGYLPAFEFPTRVQPFLALSREAQFTASACKRDVTQAADRTYYHWAQHISRPSNREATTPHLKWPAWRQQRTRHSQTSQIERASQPSISDMAMHPALDGPLLCRTGSPIATQPRTHSAFRARGPGVGRKRGPPWQQLQLRVLDLALKWGNNAHR